MAYQGEQTTITLLVTGGTSGAVAGNRIVVVDTGTVGNVAVSTAAQSGFVGVTKYATDPLGYAAIQLRGIAQITVGVSGVTAGDLIISDAVGRAATFTSSATVRQIVGIALTSAAAGNLVDVLLVPQRSSGLLQQANIAALAATTNIDAVPGTFADLAAVRTYLAGANQIPNIETRLDNIEAKINAIVGAMQTSGVTL